jgi:hypothetical protein
MAERKRAIGFALMDTAFAADAKFVRLARRAATPVDFAAAVGVFWLILADARRAKSPVVNWEDYEEYPDQIAALKDAKLLVQEGFEAETFERWAPAYHSPYDRTRGTQGDGGVRKGTQEYAVSTPINSTPITNGVGGVGEGEPQSFMRYPERKPPYQLAPGEAARVVHDGTHKDADKCIVCQPPIREGVDS